MGYEGDLDRDRCRRVHPDQSQFHYIAWNSLDENPNLPGEGLL
jgi:hypothetical protein